MRLFFTYLLPLSFVFVLSYAFYKDWGRIKEVDFVSYKDSSDEKEKQLIQDLKKQASSYVGRWVWELPIDELRDWALKHPQVEDVQIIRKWPSSYKVYLIAEKPILYLKNKSQFYPMTIRGRIGRPIPFSKLADLPLLTSPIFFKNEKLRKQAIEFFLYLPKRGLFSRENLSDIRYSKQNKSFYFYLLQGGFEIQVGEWISDFRPDRINTVLNYLDYKKIKWRIIDARLVKNIIVNLSSSSSPLN